MLMSKMAYVCVCRLACTLCLAYASLGDASLACFPLFRSMESYHKKENYRTALDQLHVAE